MWVILGIFSSFFLGFHEIFKKVAVNRNAVLPVLFTGSVTAALLFIPFLFLSLYFPGNGLIHIPREGLQAHLFFLLKSTIVACAWTFSYFSVKHLPVTLLAPVNASGPVWTLIGAMILYGERLNALQWSGVVISIGAYYLLYSSKRQTDSKSYHLKWLWFALLGILFNSMSALLDKFLVKNYDRIAMQAWFSIYTAGIFLLVLYFFWYPVKIKNTAFMWRWAAPLIGVFLVIADFLYFKALSFEGSLVSILIIIRRASAIIVFTAGAVYFREASLKKRMLMLITILAGVVLIIIGSE
jgi:transporter family protein